jgi:hypothetical protein
VKIDRPKWDPTARHLVRAGDLLFASVTYPVGAEFPVTPENEAKALKLYHMGRIVQAQELAGSTIVAPPAASTRARPRSRRGRKKAAA